METFDATPDFDSCLAGEPLPEADFAEAFAALKRATMPPVPVALELELLPGEFTPGYAKSYVEHLWLNTRPQRAVLKALLQSLTASQHELLDGTRITREEHVFQWLLEKIAVATPSDVLDRLVEAIQ